MHLFLLLLFPLVSAWFYNEFKTEGKILLARDKLLFIIYGIVTSALLSGIRAFFITTSVYYGTSFVLHMMVDWGLQFVLPALFFVLLILWSNDSWELRISSFLYFAIPFYSIYMPYDILSRGTADSFFMLFVKPVFCLLLVLCLYFEIQEFYKKLSVKEVKSVISALKILIYSFIPSAVFAFWNQSANVFVTVLLCAAVFLIYGFVLFFKLSKKTE